MNYTEEYIEIINEPKRTIYRCKICDFLSVSDKYKFENHIKSNRHFKKVNKTCENKDPETGFHSFIDIVECKFCNNQKMKYGYYVNIHSKTEKHLKRVQGDTNLTHCKYCDLTYTNYYIEIHNRSKKHNKKVQEYEKNNTQIINEPEINNSE